MPRRLTLLSIVLTFAAAAMAVVAQPAPTPAVSASQVQELRDQIAQLQQVRREMDAARETHRQQVAEVQRQIGQLRDDRGRVEPLVQQQQREVERLTAERDASVAQSAALQSQLSAMADAAQPAAAAMLEHIQRGIPFEQAERAGAVASLRGQLGSDDLLSRAGGVEALAAFAGEELQLMRTSEVWNAPLLIEDGKRRIDGYHGRLGLVSLYFLGEDGETVGMTRGGQWTFGAPPPQQQNTVRVIRMLQGQAPPGIVDAPLAPKTTEAAR